MLRFFYLTSNFIFEKLYTFYGAELFALSIVLSLVIGNRVSGTLLETLFE